MSKSYLSFSVVSNMTLPAILLEVSVTGCVLDDELEAFFLQPLIIIDEFEPPDQKSHIDFTLAYPIQHSAYASDYKSKEYGLGLPDK